MKITVLTAFPAFLEGFLSTGIIGRAVERRLIDVRVVDIRNFSRGNYHQIDDYSFGGKGGMTLMPEVLKDALDSIADGDAKVLFPTPVGAVLTQDLVESLADEPHIIIICGRYEGLDERFVEKYVDLEYSIGDYVLSGGEIPAMTLIDALARLVPGVVGKELSVADDSFYNGMLDTPHYTRPAQWEGLSVPSVLTSGDDAAILKWRRRTAAARTLSRRPDLLSRANVMDYLDDEVYLGLCVSGSPDLMPQIQVVAQAAEAYGIKRTIAAPAEGDPSDVFREQLQSIKDIKFVPSVRRMMEWAGRKEHGPLLTVLAEVPEGIPWMEAKRRIVEHSGPVLILFGAKTPPRGKNVVPMRPQGTTGAALPFAALVSAALDRFFGSR